MQGAILLIPARRADQISAEMAAHDYAADTDSEELIGEVRTLVRCIHRHVGAPDPGADDRPRNATGPASPERLERRPGTRGLSFRVRDLGLPSPW